MVRAALGLRHDVVNGHIAEGKGHPAACTDALLFAEQLVLVSPVGRELAEVRTLGNVRAAMCGEQKRPFIMEPRDN